MIKVKLIKTEGEYEVACQLIQELIGSSTEEDLENLEHLTLLVQDYENKYYQLEKPDPIEAILFRMEQQSLTPRDLIPYLGSRSKISEVLARKRPLSLAMIRALHQGLGIPAEVLLQEVDLAQETVNWQRFPIKEMIARNWIKVASNASELEVHKAIINFFKSLGGMNMVSNALYKKTKHFRSERSIDDYALVAWEARITQKAQENPPTVRFSESNLTLDFMKNLTKLSIYEDGPKLACDKLREIGVCVVIEAHLPKTHLDGAVLLDNPEMPIIGLTLRYDRIDNFWFCLMHELAHILLHRNQDTDFFDDLELSYQDDPREKEADDLAREVLIPQETWRTSPASKLKSPVAVEILAKQLNIHPAVVAGRMRYEFNAYRLFNNLVGHGKVRNCFPEVKWSE